MSEPTEFELLVGAVRVLPGVIALAEEAGHPPSLADIVEAKRAFLDGARHVLLRLESDETRPYLAIYLKRVFGEHLL